MSSVRRKPPKPAEARNRDVFNTETVGGADLPRTCRGGSSRFDVEPRSSHQGASVLSRVFDSQGVAVHPRWIVWDQQLNCASLAPAKT